MPIGTYSYPYTYAHNFMCKVYFLIHPGSTSFTSFDNPAKLFCREIVSGFTTCIAFMSAIKEKVLDCRRNYFNYSTCHFHALDTGIKVRTITLKQNLI